ncbi:MAG: hypothetical protein HY291_00340 [Planctomycetes bacterium]|nr:hypothetical protein [Planctomycetota bacterium]
MLSFIAAETAYTGTTHEDLQLLELYTGKGDRDALGELLRRHADMCFRVAQLVVSDAAEAEAAVKDAYTQIVECARQFKEGANVRAWVLSFVIQAARERKPQTVALKRFKQVGVRLRAAEGRLRPASAGRS